MGKFWIVKKYLFIMLIAGHVVSYESIKELTDVLIKAFGTNINARC